MQIPQGREGDPDYKKYTEENLTEYYERKGNPTMEFLPWLVMMKPAPEKKTHAERVIDPRELLKQLRNDPTLQALLS